MNNINDIIRKQPTKEEMEQVAIMRDNLLAEIKMYTQYQTDKPFVLMQRKHYEALIVDWEKRTKLLRSYELPQQT